MFFAASLIVNVGELRTVSEGMCTLAVSRYESVLEELHGEQEKIMVHLRQVGAAGCKQHNIISVLNAK